MKAPLSLTIHQQATAETVDLGSTHPPKEDSIKALNEILPDLKHELIHSRREKSSASPKISNPIPPVLTYCS